MWEMLSPALKLQAGIELRIIAQCYIYPIRHEEV